MNSTLCIDVAGITFGIDLPAAAWQAPVAERYAAFVSPAEGALAPAWHVTVAHDPALGFTDAAWVHHAGPVTTFRVSDHAGRIDLAARAAEVSAPSPARAGSALDRVMAYACMQALPRAGAGLLLHASGVVLEGAGCVFTGASGRGKTTVARLAARLAAGRAAVLSDENVILRIGAAGTGAELYSTPFWGHSTPPEMIHRVNRRAPLAAICLLEHAADFRLDRLGPAEAIMALLTTEKVATERPDSAAAWLAAAGKVIAHAPVYRLSFRPTPELWDFLSAELPYDPTR
jgi:hypothetical protein